MPGRTRTATPRSARSAALHLLGRRDYTSTELRRALARRGYDEAEIDRVLTDLGTAGLVDDRRAGAAHVRVAAGAKGRGRLRIERELEARGIDRSLAKDLTRTVTADDERAAIERILAAKRLPRRLGPADHRRVFQHLLRRGFPPDAIARVLRSRVNDES